MPERVRLTAFSRHLGLVAALRGGHFAAEGLAVEYERAHGSEEQLRGLLAGDRDIAHTAADNVIAWVDGGATDVFVFLVADLGVDHTLVARTALRAPSELAARTLAVDSATSGHALLLYKILAAHGLGRDDYQVLPVGGSGARLAALREGRADAALLGAPYDQAALAEGYLALASTAAFFPRHPGLAAAARRSWAAAHADTVVRYSRALRGAVGWAADPANRTALVAWLAEEDSAAAEDRYIREVRRVPVTSVDQMRASLRAVVTLRRQLLGGDEATDDLSRYFDPRYAIAADPLLATDTGPRA